MNVLLITRKYPPAVGGMETWSHELYSGLKSKCNITLLKPEVIKTGRTSLSSIIKFFLSTFFHLMFNYHKYDIVHIGDGALYSLSFAKLFNFRARNTKTIVSLHGLDTSFPLQKGTIPFIYKIYQSFIPFSPVNVWVGNSNFTISLLRARFPKSILKTHTVHLGTKIGEPVLKTYSKPIKVIYAGRIVYRKGLPWFIQEVLDKADIELHVVGPNTLNINLSHPKITYHNSLPQDQLFELLKEMHVGIFPNIAVKGDIEGFGLMSLEYAANGLIVLASNIEGLRESAQQPIGFLLNSGDSEAWASMLSHISDWSKEDFDTFTSKSYNHIKKNLTWSIFVNNYYNLYKNIYSNQSSYK